MMFAASSPPSLGWHSPFSPKTISREDRELKCSGHLHNNTIDIILSVAQVDAYSPGEDRVYTNKDDNLFAIFDGHGGDICSRYVVDKLPKQLLACLQQRKPKSEQDYRHALKTSFCQVDEQFLSEHKSIVRTSPAGSCGVSVLVRDDKLYVCNVGDSRVLLGSAKETENTHQLLTNDHNTRNERERALVKARTTDPIPIRTGIATKVEGDRIGGILMVTRAFGDGIFKRRDMSLHPLIPHLPYITSEPEITIHTLTPQDRYAVISSDGLYECLSPAMVAACVEKQLETTSDPTTIAASLLELMFSEIARLLHKTTEQVKQLPNRKNFMDDTSIIVLIFRHSSSLSSSLSFSPSFCHSLPVSPSLPLSPRRRLLYHGLPQH